VSKYALFGWLVSHHVGLLGCVAVAKDTWPWETYDVLQLWESFEVPDVVIKSQFGALKEFVSLVAICIVRVLGTVDWWLQEGVTCGWQVTLLFQLIKLVYIVGLYHLFNKVISHASVSSLTCA